MKIYEKTFWVAQKCPKITHFLPSKWALNQGTDT